MTYRYFTQSEWDNGIVHDYILNRWTQGWICKALVSKLSDRAIMARFEKE